MKRIFMSAMAFLLATAAVQAQTDTTSHSRSGRHKMQKEGPYTQLNLTADQQAKLQSLRDEFRQKREALRNEKLTEAERKTQLQALHQQHKTATEVILTPAQKEQLEKARNERKDIMRNGKRPIQRDSSVTRNNGRGAHLQRELALTAEQQEKMKAIRSEFKKDAETLRNDQSLTQEQKREKLRGLMQAQQQALKTILTKEQQEKLQTLRTERAARNTR